MENTMSNKKVLELSNDIVADISTFIYELKGLDIDNIEQEDILTNTEVLDKLIHFLAFATYSVNHNFSNKENKNINEKIIENYNQVMNQLYKNDTSLPSCFSG
jgi:hypothetical protein